MNRDCDSTGVTRKLSLENRNAHLNLASEKIEKVPRGRIGVRQRPPRQRHGFSKQESPERVRCGRGRERRTGRSMRTSCCSIGKARRHESTSANGCRRRGNARCKNDQIEPSQSSVGPRPLVSSLLGCHTWAAVSHSWAPFAFPPRASGGRFFLRMKSLDSSEELQPDMALALFILLMNMTRDRTIPQASCIQNYNILPKKTCFPSDHFD